MNKHAEHARRTQVIIPGAGGYGAAELLEPPRLRLVSGNEDAGFYQRATPESVAADRGGTEAYSWAGLTSGDWTRALWLLLLPFMLANVGYWMAPAAPPEDNGAGGLRRGTRLTAEALQRLLALSLTAVLVVAAISVSMDLVGSQCVVDGRACTSTLGFLAWPWLTGPRRLVLTAVVPTALVLLLWWLGNRTWQRMECAPVPPAAPTGVRTPLEDRRMWNGRRSVRRLRAVHVTAAFAVIAVFVVVPSLGSPARGLAAVIDPGEWRRSGGWPVVAVLMVSLALLAGLSVTALLPIMGQRDRPGAATAPRPLEKPLFRWLPWLGVALVGLAAAATLGPAHPAGRSAPLPWLSGAITALFVGQVAATVALALCCWLAPRPPASRTSPRAPAGRMIDRPVWLGMAPAVTAGLAWLLQDGIAAGVTLLVADRLGTPGPPADGSAGNPHTFAVAPPVLWAAATTVGLAGVILIVAAAWLLLRPSPSTAVAEQIKRAYRYQNLDAAPPGSARRRRADAIIRDWTRGTLVGTVEHLGGWLAIAAGIVVTAGVVLDLTTRPDFFGRSWRWPVTIGGWLLGGLVLVLFTVGRQAYASPAWRRTVGILWDLGTFWPRATHPLAPPCYAERAVPDLLNRITYLAGTWEQPEEDAGWGRPPRDGDVLVSAHSQGSVIAAATVMQLSEETCDRVRLLTYGSPLRRLYARFFPAYFGLDALGRLARLLGAPPGENVVGARPGEDVASARWRNLHRPSDPVGGYIFQEFWPYEWADERQRRQATQDQLERHVDCALLDPAFDRAPGDSCYPPTYGHSAYPRDPAFAQAVAWLWRRGHDSRVDDVDWRSADATST